MPHTATLIAILLYALAHAAGYLWPAELWGVDQLHYYGTWASVGFAAVSVWSLVAGSIPVLKRADRRATLVLRRLLQKPRSAMFMGAGALLVFVAAAWLLRVRAHLLGDSDKWFQLLQSAPGLAEILATLGRGEFPVLPIIPTFEGLDFILHLGSFILAQALFDWGPDDTYAALSLLAGVIFVAGLWRLCALLTTGAAERVTLVLLVLTTGAIQLFFGYGESYSLVTAATIWYFVFALRGLNDGGLVAPTVALCLCLALHLMALGLLPSWLYLVWIRTDRPLERYLRSARVVVPVAGLAVLAAGALYVNVFPYSLPLLPSAESYSHSLFSLSHLALLGNTLLLVSPLALVWGLSTLRQASRVPSLYLLLWASVGTGGIIFLNDAFLGGRDWDMLSYPGLCLTIWGIASLNHHPQRRRLLRWLRWTVIPLVSCHTLLWVGINAHEGRALARLENLLQYSNAPAHYRYWTLGYFYTNVLDQHYDRAVHYYTKAVAAATAWWQESLIPVSTLVGVTADPLHYWNLSSAHRRLGNHVQAIEDFRRSLAMSDTPGADMLALGDFYLRDGDKDLAALAYGQLLHPNVAGLTSNDLRRAGVRLYKSGHLAESSQAYERALQMDPYNHVARTHLAWNHYQLGRYDDAIEQYSRVLEAQQTPEAAFGLALSNLRAAYIDSAWAAYDRAVQHHSADLGRRVMADENLRRLANRGTVPAAAAILRTYWP